MWISIRGWWRRDQAATVSDQAHGLMTYLGAAQYCHIASKMRNYKKLTKEGAAPRYVMSSRTRPEAVVAWPLLHHPLMAIHGYNYFSNIIGLEDCAPSGKSSTDMSQLREVFLIDHRGCVFLPFPKKKRECFVSVLTGFASMFFFFS